jgi:hypothetical protein
MVKVTAWFLMGLLPYAYLPLSSTVLSPRWTWGDQSTLSGFLTHLLRQEYGTWSLVRFLFSPSKFDSHLLLKIYSDSLASVMCLWLHVLVMHEVSFDIIL